MSVPFPSFAAWLRVSLLALLLGGNIFAQGTLTTLFTNGPASNRVNIVLLSEGYPAAQLADFPAAASNVVNALLVAPPFADYRSYFNAYAISVASAQSGSDHPAQNVSKDTYFNSTYDLATDRVITIPNGANGKDKVRNLLTNLMPEYDYAILVVNDSKYGGSGEPPDSTALPLAITCINPTLYSEIITHESGHAFAALADEYVLGDATGITPVERPNVTAQTNRALIKWTSWISNSVPLPTPDDPTNDLVVGLFQGAQYQSNGWYRPKRDCKMKTISETGDGVPFCEVCSEAIVKSIYANNHTQKKIRTIETASPATTNLTLATSNAFTFSLATLQPATHPLSIQWFSNNVPIAEATNPAFTLRPGNLANGNLNIRAVVRDQSPLVRIDPQNLLSNSVSWTVNIAQSELRLVNPRWLTTNQFTFAVTGAAPLGFNLQSSSDLAGWTNISFHSLSGGGLNFTSSVVGSPATRYFRAVVTNTP